MDQFGLSLESYHFYTDEKHQVFIDFFTTVAQLLDAKNPAAKAEAVWQLEKALAEVISCLKRSAQVQLQ